MQSDTSPAAAAMSAADALREHDQRRAAAVTDLAAVEGRLAVLVDPGAVRSLTEQKRSLNAELEDLDAERAVLARAAARERKEQAVAEYRRLSQQRDEYLAAGRVIADRISAALDRLPGDVAQLLGMQSDWEVIRAQLRHYAKEADLPEVTESRLPSEFIRTVGFTETFFRPFLIPFAERLVEYSRRGWIRNREQRT